MVGYSAPNYLFAYVICSRFTIDHSRLTMRITKDTKRLPKKMPPPELEWQTGDFAKCQEFRFHLPYGFLLLCKLWNTTPGTVLSDFMDNISCGSWKRDAREKAKVNLVNYILEMKYGLDHYTEKDLLQMFTELDAIGMLWPENAKMKFIETHAKWRDNYYNWWFKKWYKKYHRKLKTDL
jgi:hypothetical protein